jgi:hypothetical protein
MTILNTLNKLNKWIIIGTVSLLIIILIAVILISKKSPANQSAQNFADPTVYNDQYISLKIPPEWIAGNTRNTSLVTLEKPKEIITDPQAKTLNFKSSIKVSQRPTYGRTLDQISEFIIKTEIQTGENAKMLKQSTTEINQTPTQIIEATFAQQKTTFNVLMTVTVNKDKYYLLNATTTPDKWQEYKDIFYQTAQNFKIL